MAGRVVNTKLTKFFTYSRAAKSQSEYATNMKRLSNQIFGEVRRPMNPAQQKFLAKFQEEPKDQNEQWVTYYPAVEETNELMKHLREYGLYRWATTGLPSLNYFRDEHKDFCEEMERLRTLRGKSRVRWVTQGGQVC